MAEEGLLVFLVKSFKYFKRFLLRLLSPIIIPLKLKNKFFFQNQVFNYFYHKNNLTWTNERAVEIPIVMGYLNNFKAGRILEVGAVLPQYFPMKWDVLDKFEKGKGIINEDVVNFKPKNKYDLIISISTLEHVGFDDDIKEPEKILKALKNLIVNGLNKNGKMIVTLPLGYNHAMDSLLFSGKLNFDRIFFMKRVSRNNQWKEIDIENAKGARYGKPYLAANVLAIGILEKK
ncbi:MAG: hypothetical protein AABW48_00190 [Nanoarchaeota archaeon]